MQSKIHSQPHQDNISYKAPDSFILFCRKRKHELKVKGQYITSNELLEEWKMLSNEQKEEFHNQSQCIQFTLDIENGTKNAKLNITHLSPSSMIIPNEEDPATQKPLTLSLYQEKIPPATIHTKPEKVKRPPNAYLLFNRDMRSRLKGINKGLTSGEISKNISQRWKQLSKIEKDEYFKQEALLKHTLPNVIYFRRSNAELKKAGKLKKAQTSSPSSIEKKTFYKKKSNTDDCGGIPDPRGRKKKSNTALPKHPMSAYLHFAKKMRPIIKESFPDATLVDISRQIGSKWRSLSPSELCPWIELANQDKARYAKETKDIINENMTS